MTPSPDSAALAKQFGATSSVPITQPTGAPSASDSAAIARQYGATSSTPMLSLDPTRRIPIDPNPSMPADPPAKVGFAGNDDDLIRMFGYDPALIKSSKQYQDRVKANGSGLAFALNTGPTDIDNMPVLGQLEDIGHGAMDIPEGIMQLGRHVAGKMGLMPNADVQYNDLLARVSNQDYLQNIRKGNSSGVARIVGNMLMPVPGGPEAEAGDTMLKTVLKGGLQGAKYGALQPVTSGDPDSFGTQKGLQIGTGAVVGGGTSAVVQGATRLGTKAYNAATGNLPADAQAVIDQGKKWGVDTTLGDVNQNPSTQKTEVLMEQLPGLGMSAQRAEQQAQVRAAAAKLQSRSQDALINTEPSALHDLQTAAANGDNTAGQVLDKVNSAGNKPGAVQQAGILAQDWSTATTAEAKYAKIAALAKSNNLNDVPLTGTQGALNDTIDEASNAKIPNGPLVAALKTIKKNISPQPAAPSTTPNLFPQGSALFNQFEAARVSGPPGPPFAQRLHGHPQITGRSWRDDPARAIRQECADR